MSKENVLSLFQMDLDDPGSQRSGEYLEARILEHARRAQPSDRSGLIEAVAEWLGLRQLPQTMLAVNVCRDLHLAELREPLEQLRQEILDERTFKPYYAEQVEQALAALQENADQE